MSGRSQAGLHIYGTLVVVSATACLPSDATQPFPSQVQFQMEHVTCCRARQSQRLQRLVFPACMLTPASSANWCLMGLTAEWCFKCIEVQFVVVKRKGESTCGVITSSGDKLGGPGSVTS